MHIQYILSASSIHKSYLTYFAQDNQVQLTVDVYVFRRYFYQTVDVIRSLLLKFLKLKLKLLAIINTYLKIAAKNRIQESRYLYYITSRYIGIQVLMTIIIFQFIYRLSFFFFYFSIECVSSGYDCYTVTLGVFSRLIRLFGLIYI